MPESEEAFVQEFISCLGKCATPWGALRFSLEFDTGEGRTDVLASDNRGHIMAFEAKLTKWRDALHQAYGNTVFAAESYVLLPKQIAEVAMRYSGEFHQRSVGLCYLEEGNVVVAIEAKEVTPVQPLLTIAAREFIQQADTCPKLRSKESRKPTRKTQGSNSSSVSAKVPTRKLSAYSTAKTHSH